MPWKNSWAVARAGPAKFTRATAAVPMPPRRAVASSAWTPPAAPAPIPIIPEVEAVELQGLRIWEESPAAPTPSGRATDTLCHRLCPMPLGRWLTTTTATRPPTKPTTSSPLAAVSSGHPPRSAASWNDLTVRLYMAWVEWSSQGCKPIRKAKRVLARIRNSLNETATNKKKTKVNVVINEERFYIYWKFEKVY